jgi:uncharacterized protein YndB with AHSA1/START domain
MESLRYELDLPASRDTVWDLWTTAEGLTQWLCLRANVQPVVGGPYELFWNPDASKPDSDSTLGCRILSIDRPRLLGFSWRGADQVAGVMNAPDAPQTRVEVTLTPRPLGTRLNLVHQGWGHGPEWAQARAWFDRAWSGALEKLLTLCRQAGP